MIAPCSSADVILRLTEELAAARCELAGLKREGRELSTRKSVSVIDIAAERKRRSDDLEILKNDARLKAVLATLPLPRGMRHRKTIRPI